MLRVQDIMSPNVVTLSPDQSLREAVETLVACRIGGAPVVEGEEIVGVISAADILEFEAMAPADEESEVEHPDEESEVSLDEDEIEEWQEGEDLTSTYFTDLWTQRGPDTVERIAARSGVAWDVLGEHVVSEAMSRTVCTVKPAAEVSWAAQRMLAAGAQRALVSDGKSLLGIITTTDILRAVAEQRLTVRRFVFDSKTQ
jgi:CBS domain-containing protein